MRSRKSSLGVMALLWLTLVIGLVGGVALDRGVLIAYAAPAEAPSNAPIDLQLLTQAVNLVQRIYVDRSAVQEKNLTYGAIRGMVDALGDTGHSRFLSPELVQQEHDYMQGKFTGIGAEVEKKGDHIVIVAPLDNSPAQKAGLRAGDIILKVNGVDVTGQSVEQVIEKIIGPAGTQVTVTVLDPESDIAHDITITRAQIVVQNVTWQRLPGTTIAHLRLAGFSQGITKDLQKALSNIEQAGLTGVVLDLRNNPGGLLDEAVGTTSQFLSSGNVLLEKDSQGKETAIPVRAGGAAYDLPMVVLINDGSASAAEIVSGALQDYHRASLLGEKTFGTGTVLNEFSLADGSELLLATEEWLTPNGRVIWHQGIAPDQMVLLPSTVAPLTPEAERGMTLDQFRGSGDAQLMQALELLQPSVERILPRY